MRQQRLLVLTAGLCATAALGLVAPHPASAVSAHCSYASPAHHPTLTYGDTGEAVKQAQCLSNIWGGQPPQLALDGVFDSVMLKKVEWIQGCHGLPRSGVIEGRTWQVLYHPVLDCYAPYPT